MNRQLINAMAAQYATPEVSGDGVVSWDGGKKCVIPSVKLYGAAVQDGTPSPDAPVMPVCNNGVFAARGRNLFGMQYYTTYATAFCEENNGVIHIAGAEGLSLTAASAGQIQFVFADLPEGQTYTVSIPVELLSVGVRENKTQLYAGPKDNYAKHDSLRKTVPENARTVIQFTILAKTPIATLTMRLNNCEWNIYADQIQIEVGNTATPHTPYYDGGQAQAPELWAIPGTEYRDEWDPQTGRGVRRVLVVDALDPRLKLSHWNNSVSENSIGVFLTSNSLFGVYKAEKIVSNAGVCSHCAAKGETNVSRNNFVWRVAGTSAPPYISLRVPATTFDDAKLWLQEQADAGTPVRFWIALKDPEPFYSPPTRLTMPTGYGQIIQTSGDIPDCLITARYLTHR